MYSYQRSISTNQIPSMYNRSSFDYHQSNTRYPNLQRSNSVIVSKRGFKPSDRFDPAKKEFLLQLSKKIWQRDAAPGKPVDLQKILTPAEDAEEIVPQKNRKLYASSAFFTPGLHPTVEDQVELARRISSSLCDSSNQQSKGQSMYVNRMKRSVKWVHEGEDVYTPPEIPLHVYGAPPTNNYLPPVQQPQYNASSYQAPPPSSVYSPYQQQAASPPSSAYYKPNPINYSPPNQGINQQPSTTFNPSPIANDKLAIFEQSQQYQSSQHQSRQQTRRPLTVPNTIVRNQSPLPYGSSPVSKPNYGQQQKYPSQAPPQGQPITLYNNTSKNAYQSSQDNYSYQSSPVSNPRSQINLDQVENYNRAARGWGQTRDYYRPITFSKPKVALPYSDF